MSVRRLLLGAVMIMVVVSCGSDSDIADEGSSDTPTAVPEAAAPTVAAEPTPAPTVTSEPTPAPTAEDPPATVVFGDQFPEVLAVAVQPADGEEWRFNVTLSSPYDTPERYADAWRVLNADGEELGIRILGHDHANEQPFTRSHTVQVPAGTKAVWVEGRDQANGWSGQRFEVSFP